MSKPTEREKYTSHIIAININTNDKWHKYKEKVLVAVGNILHLQI